MIKMVAMSKLLRLRLKFELKLKDKRSGHFNSGTKTVVATCAPVASSPPTLPLFHLIQLAICLRLAGRTHDCGTKSRTACRWTVFVERPARRAVVTK